MNRLRATAIMGFALVVAGGILVWTTPTSLTCSGAVDCVNMNLTLLRAQVGIGVTAVGLLALAATATAGVRRLAVTFGVRVEPHWGTWSRWLVALGLVLAPVGLALTSAAQIESITCGLSSCAGLPLAYAVASVGEAMAAGGVALEGFAMFAAVRSLPRGAMARSARPAATRDAGPKRLALAGGALFAVGFILAFTPLVRWWTLGSCDGLCSFWTDVVFPFRIPGAVIGLLGTGMVVVAGLRFVQERPVRWPRNQTRTVQILLVSALVLATTFTSAVIATAPGPVVLVPVGRVLHLQSSGGDPWLYFINVSVATARLTGAWQADEPTATVYPNADYPVFPEGYCPPPGGGPFAALSGHGTIDETFPPGTHTAVFWACIVPPATITITQAIVFAPA